MTWEGKQSDWNTEKPELLVDEQTNIKIVVELSAMNTCHHDCMVHL